MSKNKTSNWSAMIARLMQTLGVQHVAISPGYRNSSLIQAFTYNKHLHCHSFIDERSAAFFALGVAKNTGLPAVVVSTSGTAVANFFPAIVEASLSTCPLIVISADRPSNLIGTGENQTIDQHKIFGKFVNTFVDIGIPRKNQSGIKKKLIHAFQASIGVDKKNNRPGPVHINCPIDMPAINPLINININIDNLYPLVKVNYQPVEALDPGIRTLIVCGPMNAASECKEIIDLADHWKSPVFADPTSQIKYSSSSTYLIDSYDLLLKYMDIKPNLIVRFGKKPTSKSLGFLLKKFKKRTVTVGQYKQSNDDTKKYIQSITKDFCIAQISKTDKKKDTGWLKSIEKESARVKSIVNKNKFSRLIEPFIYTHSIKMLARGDSMFVGNSMPIRDMDSYTSACDKKIKILSNRGVSGIDGLIASAIGMAASSNKNNLLILGDVSFAHDFGSLVDAIRSNINLTVVVVNNDGGNIFNQLPIKEFSKKTYKHFWLTPPNLDIRSICKGLKIQFAKTKTVAGYKKALSKSLKTKGLGIIEVLCDVKSDNKFREKIIKDITSS